MRWSRMTSMAKLLLQRVGEEAEEAGTLDGLGQFALLLGGDGGDARGHHLAALGDVALQQAHVLEVDLGRILAAEGAGLAAAKEGPPAGGAAAAAGTLAAPLAWTGITHRHHAPPSRVSVAGGAPPPAPGPGPPKSRRGRSSRSLR